MRKFSLLLNFYFTNIYVQTFPLDLTKNFCALRSTPNFCTLCCTPIKVGVNPLA
jgi:hypothetical protein